MLDSHVGSLFAYLRNHFGQRLPAFRSSKITLIDLSHTLENLVFQTELPAVIFTGFQESRYWSAEVDRYVASANTTQQICIFARGVINVPNEHYTAVALADTDPLRFEWFVLVLTDTFSALLCGHDCEEAATSEATRSFDTLFTFAPDAIEECVELLLNVADHYRADLSRRLYQACKQFPPVAPQGDDMTRLVAMMMDKAQYRNDQLQAALTQHQQMQTRQERLERNFVEVAVPVIPLIAGVLVMPLVGQIDAQRSQLVMEKLLEGITEHQADVAILDITGVPFVDTRVANTLIQTVKAANLLGVRVILTGLGADIAQTLIHLEVDFSNMQTCATLQVGIEAALAIRKLQMCPTDDAQ